MQVPPACSLCFRQPALIHPRPTTHNPPPQWVPAEQLPVKYGGQCSTPLGESELELQMAAYVHRLNQQAETAATAAAAAGSKLAAAAAGEAAAEAAAEAWQDAEGEAEVLTGSAASSKVY